MKIDSDLRGAQSEALVEQALETLQRKKNSGLAARIRGFIHASRNSKLDREHIDFLVTLDDGRDIPLQVKSSERQKRKFERRARAFQRFIPVVVVELGDALSSVINKVMKCLIAAFVKARQHSQELQARVTPVRRHRKKPWCVRFHAPSMCH